MKHSLYLLIAGGFLLTMACEPASVLPPVSTSPADTATAPSAARAPTPTPPSLPAPTVEPTLASTANAFPKNQRGQGGRLRLLYWQAPTILNTHLSQGADYDAGRLVLEPLAAIGPDGRPVAELAAAIPTIDNGGISRDQKTITWKLRQDVKWSDGSPFTSDDVVFTYKYIANPDVAATDTQTVDGVDTVTAPDQYTVVVTYKNPSPNPYQLFVSGYGDILQKKQFDRFLGPNAKDAPGNLSPVGTGPYKVVDFRPGDVVTYTINELYRDPNKPYWHDVEIKGGGDTVSAARAVFQTGEADYAWNLQVEPQVLQQLEQGGKARLITASSPNVERLNFQFADPNSDELGARSEPGTKHPFLSDLNVRKALAMAVDRKSISDQLYGQGGAATCNVITSPPDLVSHNTDSMDICQYNVSLANQVLDQAGWTRGPDGIRQKNGVRLHIVYQTTVNSLRQKEQDIVKAGWEQLGAEVELKSIDAGVFFSSDAGNPDTAAHFYADVEMYTDGAVWPDQTQYLDGWTTEQIASKADQWHGLNYERWSNSEYDSIYNQLKVETDPSRRGDLIIKANDLLISQVVVIPLVARTQPTDGISNTIKGEIPNPWDSVLWQIADWYR
jgi:peptide/nickel transport system substrate-binding protein